MGLFGKLLKATFDVVTLPVDIAKDVVTMGGALNDSGSAVIKKLQRLEDDGEEIQDELDEL
jgi:hypothetical protein